MEINSKDELNSTLEEIMARLSMIEQSSTEKKDDEQSKEEDEPKDEETEVESVDEIQKLLNA